MIKNPKTKYNLKIIGLILFYFIAQQTTLIFIQIGQNPDNTSTKKLIFNCLSIILPGLIVYQATKTIKQREYHVTQLTNIASTKPKWTTILYWFITLYSAIIIVAIITQYLGLNTGAQTNQESLNNLTTLSSMIPMGLSVIILAPFVEELIFRELMPALFDTTTTHITAFIIPTLIFITLHSPSNIFGWCIYSTLGFTLMLSRTRSKSIWTSIIVHMLWNGQAFLQMILPLFKST